MKRYSLEEIERIAERAYRTHRREIRRKRINAEKIEEFQRFRQRYIARSSDLIDIDDTYIPLEVPRSLSLNENRLETINFINEIREIVLHRRMPVFLSFAKSEKIGSSAAIALSAEIFRCRYLRRFRNKKSVHGDYPLNESVLEILLKLGFFDAIEVKSFEPRPESEGDLYVKIQSFNRVDSELINRVASSLAKAFPHLSDISKRRMYAAAVEALSNTFEHAFDQKPPHPLQGRKGWLGAMVSPSGNQFTLMVFDQGAGIPATLDRTMLEAIRQLGFIGSNVNSDGAMIQAATKIGRTSTGQSGRGKGFETMRRFIDSCEDGELRIFSNHGGYLYTKASETIFDDVSGSLGGTLVLWRIRHSGTEIAQNE